MELSREGPIEAFVPMTLFAILFGLSMDYEVFLLSRVRENYIAGDGNSEAVARGVADGARDHGGGDHDRRLPQLRAERGPRDQGVRPRPGHHIFVDATIVRLVPVPATMGLIGEANWCFPACSTASSPASTSAADRPRWVAQQVAVASAESWCPREDSNLRPSD